VKDLRSSPEKFKNKIVETTGFYKSDFEKSALYEGLISFLRDDSQTAIWISFNAHLLNDGKGIDLINSSQEFEKIKGKKLRIKGIFNPGPGGHFDRYFGSIENVVYLEIIN
jgi:hypothetical protein